MQWCNVDRLFFSPGAFLSYLRHRSAHPTLSYIRIRPQARTADGYRTGGGRRRQRFDTTSMVSDSCPSWLAGASWRRRRSWCPSPSQRNFPAQAPEPPPQSREGQVLRSTEEVQFIFTKKKSWNRKYPRRRRMRHVRFYLFAYTRAFWSLPYEKRKVMRKVQNFRHFPRNLGRWSRTRRRIMDTFNDWYNAINAEHRWRRHNHCHNGRGEQVNTTLAQGRTSNYRKN